jgi:hypothetical protein
MAVSSFSEYTVVDMNQVVKLDPAVPPMLGCLLGCGEPSSFFLRIIQQGRPLLLDYIIKNQTKPAVQQTTKSKAYTGVDELGGPVFYKRNQVLTFVVPLPGVGAAWRLARVEPGSSVVIFGMGSVGLAVRFVVSMTD